MRKGQSLNEVLAASEIVGAIKEKISVTKMHRNLQNFNFLLGYASVYVERMKLSRIATTELISKLLRRSDLGHPSLNLKPPEYV